MKTFQSNKWIIYFLFKTNKWHDKRFTFQDKLGRTWATWPACCLWAGAVSVAAVRALGVVRARIPALAESGKGQLDYLRPVSLASCTYQSSGPSSGSVHFLLLWSKTRPSVHPSSLGVMENSQTMYFLHEEGWANVGWARVIPVGPIVSPSGHSKPSMLGLDKSFSHFLANDDACSSLTQVPWASSKTRGVGQSYGWGKPWTQL